MNHWKNLAAHSIFEALGKLSLDQVLRSQGLRLIVLRATHMLTSAGPFNAVLGYSSLHPTGQNANVGMLPPSDSEDESEEEEVPTATKSKQVATPQIQDYGPLSVAQCIFLYGWH